MLRRLWFTSLSYKACLSNTVCYESNSLQYKACTTGSCKPSLDNCRNTSLSILLVCRPPAPSPHKARMALVHLPASA